MSNDEIQVPEITVAELKERLEDNDAPMLVDVREAFEREIADLPAVGQRHIPLGEFVDRMGEIDRESDVVVYCRTGARSHWAVGLLIGHGYTRALNLQGGVMAWREEIDPSLQAY